MRHKSDPLFSLKNKAFEQLMAGNKGVEERMMRKRVSPTWRSLYRLWMQELKGERKILEALDVQEENRKEGNSYWGRTEFTKNIKRSMCVKRVQGEHDECRDVRLKGQRSLCRTSRYISRMGLTEETVVKLILKTENCFKVNKSLLLLQNVLRRL